VSRENVEVVRRIYGALNQGDIDAALDASEDEVLHDWSRSVGPYQGIYRGREEVRAFWHAVGEATSALSFDVEQMGDGKASSFTLFENKHDALEAVGQRE
jgi:ketosteroid isomerase-like protein